MCLQPQKRHKNDFYKYEPITFLTESEPKLDNELLNKPLRPANDEISLENPGTTPLASSKEFVTMKKIKTVEEPS